MNEPNQPPTVPSVHDIVHTPGPWGYHFTEINPYHAYIHGDDKECIALMDSRGGLAKIEEIKANAKLIAATPEMWAAIQLAIAFLAGGFEVETADELAEKHPAAAGALRVLLPFAEARTMAAIKR